MTQYNIVILNGHGKPEVEYLFGNDTKNKTGKSKKVIVKSLLYGDDTINTIKKKILKHCTPGYDRCYEEIYLFTDTGSVGISLPDEVTINPFEFSQYSMDSISVTDDESLLIDHIPKSVTTIYVCFMEELRDRTNIGKILPIYFPSIDSVDQLNSLRLKSKKLLSKDFDAESDYIALFYSLGNKINKKVNDIIEGINHLDIVYIPETQFNISLDDVFNLMHATAVLPLIQYNVTGRDRQYRLYAPNKATNGEHIPFLDKAVINKFRKKKPIN